MVAVVTETYRANLLVGPATPGLRAVGVPPGGWSDPVARLVATGLLSDATACLEVVARLRAVTDSDTRVAVLTPGAIFSVGGHPHTGPAIMAWRAGEELVVGPDGARVTVCWDGLRCSGHEPTEVPSEIAGMASKGATFRIDPSLWPSTKKLRFVACSSRGAFLGHVLPESDRVGTRIDARLGGQPSLEQSQPSVTGMIQETPDGTVLVHGPDGPTIGGYARIGAVIEADWSAVARLPRGAEVEFVPVSLAEAIRARSGLKDRVTKTLAQIRLAGF